MVNLIKITSIVWNAKMLTFETKIFEEIDFFLIEFTHQILSVIQSSQKKKNCKAHSLTRMHCN